jgi:hypothetical protein
MKKVSCVFSLILFASVALVSRPGLAADDDASRYVKLLGNTFELQIQTLELLVASETAYRENAARHAMDIVSTADLLTDTIDKIDLASSSMDRTTLKKLNDATYIAAKDLSRAIKYWLEGEDNTKVVKAIKTLRITCDNCHGS